MNIVCASERLLTGQEVATYLGVTSAWVRAHAAGSRAPVLPSIKVGKERRYRCDAIEQFVLQCEAITRDRVQVKRRMRRTQL
jgi:hypothetical protein